MSEEKLYTCGRCRKQKPPTEFFPRYDRKNPRPATYCKPCNREYSIEAKYKREARANPQAFAQRIARAEDLLGLMVRALRSVGV